MAEAQFLQEQVALFGPLVNKLLTMLGAARDAYNRHSRESLQELLQLRGQITQDFAAAATQFKSLVAKQPEAERPGLLRMHSILSHLELIGENIGSLADPIQKKIREGVLFSDKGVAQCNKLFDQHTGMIRSLLDIIKTDNDYLKQYVLAEGRKLIQACNDFATEHEERLIEGVCLPQAAPIFLAMLDRMRIISRHEIVIADLLAQKP